MSITPVNSVSTELNTASDERVDREIPKWGTAKKVAVCSLNLLASPLWCGACAIGATVCLYKDLKPGYVHEHAKAQNRYDMRFMLKGMIPIYNAFYMTKMMEKAVQDCETSSIEEE